MLKITVFHVTAENEVVTRIIRYNIANGQSQKNLSFYFRSDLTGFLL